MIYNGFIKPKGAVNMDKIKLMDHVVKTMKEKKGFQGTLKAEAKRDQTTIFHIDREFAKNGETGVAKVKSEAELNFDGKTVKRESNTEINLKDFDETQQPALMRLIRWRQGMRFGGFKEGLNKLGFFLNLLNSAHLEEREDHSYNLSLSLDGFPEEIREIIQERMDRRELGPYFENSPLQELTQKIQSVKDLTIKMNMVINKDFEVERIVREFSGKLKDETNTEHQWNMNTELSLAW